MNAKQRKHRAGSDTARADHRRGMPIETMARLNIRAKFDRNWVAGYSAVLEQLKLCTATKNKCALL